MFHYPKQYEKEERILIMKLSRKILSLVLALVMVMGLAATAFAEGNAETTGSITITNALKGETYKAYQILYLESYDAEKKYMPTRPILPGKNG